MRLQALHDKYSIEQRTSHVPAEIRAQIEQLQARRVTLIGRYTPAHPAVQQIERHLHMLQAQLAAAEAAPAAKAPPAP